MPERKMMRRRFRKSWPNSAFEEAADEENTCTFTSYVEKSAHIWVYWDSAIRSTHSVQEKAAQCNTWNKWKPQLSTFKSKEKAKTTLNTQNYDKIKAHNYDELAYNLDSLQLPFSTVLSPTLVSCSCSPRKNAASEAGEILCYAEISYCIMQIFYCIMQRYPVVLCRDNLLHYAEIFYCILSW